MSVDDRRGAPGVTLPLPGDRPFEEEVREVTAFLERVGAARHVLDTLPPADRTRLLRAVSQVHAPNRVQRRRASSAARMARTDRVEAVRADTGIRALRRRPVVTTPSVFAPPAFEPQDVHADAEREVTEARLSTAATTRIVSRRRRILAAHAVAYAVINALLFAVNFLSTPGEWWVLFPVFFWGLGLLLHAGFGLSKHVSERRLTREKRRLLEAASAGVTRLVERRTGVRVAGPVDQIEDPRLDEADEAARKQRGSRDQ